MKLTAQTAKDLQSILETLDQRIFEIRKADTETDASAERRGLEEVREAVLGVIEG